MRNLTAPENKARYSNLYWVTNNPWEERHVFVKTGADIKARLMRPVGFSDVDPGENYPGDPNKAAVIHTHVDVEEMLKMHGVPYEKILNEYGGTIGLKRYKVFVDFPYQVSTMKMYENIAAGVVSLAPTPEFFETIVKNGSVAFWPWDDHIGDHPDNWTLYVETYNPTFQPFYKYFSSWTELSHIVNNMSVEEIDEVNNVRVKGPRFFENVLRRESVEGWAKLFRDMGFGWVKSGIV
ncbi:hypothetical protein HDU76_009846 [Blyttiomyces sp. JEL0837]|nr:hypothetical protein HDU76_009846 [Blyttiomyces sp. JEL0837]